MIFAGGTILPQEALPALLDTLEERLDETRSGRRWSWTLSWTPWTAWGGI